MICSCYSALRFSTKHFFILTIQPVSIHPCVCTDSNCSRWCMGSTNSHHPVSDVFQWKGRFKPYHTSKISNCKWLLTFPMMCANGMVIKFESLHTKCLFFIAAIQLVSFANSYTHTCDRLWFDFSAWPCHTLNNV